MDENIFPQKEIGKIIENVFDNIFHLEVLLHAVSFTTGQFQNVFYQSLCNIFFRGEREIQPANKERNQHKNKFAFKLPFTKKLF